jgi:starch synthase
VNDDPNFQFPVDVQRSKALFIEEWFSPLVAATAPNRYFLPQFMKNPYPDGTQPLRCLYAASEVAGFAKTGGLADVAASLPRALAERGLDCAVIMPLYRCVRAAKNQVRPTGLRFSVPIGARPVSGSLYRGTLPHSKVPIFFVEQADFFERDVPASGAGLYQFTLPDGGKRDYPDNSARYIFFCRAVLEAMRLLDYWPDVLHVNDWQTGLLPVYVREQRKAHRLTRSGEPSRLAGPATEVGEKIAAIRTLFTIHNIAYQGLFWHFDMPLTGLPWSLFNYEEMEFHGHVNFLKGGIVFADSITTVSPMYSREIQTPYYGCGLHGVLAHRSHDIHGIVNGADYHVWDPAIDPHLAAKYDAGNVQAGKAACKKALQKHYQLPEKPLTPLLGMVSRLVDQKGLDLVGQSAQALLQHDLQLVVLGEGDPTYHAMLLDLRKKYPGRVGVTLGQDEKLAHQIEGGADMFLMPSQYEPCGLNQLYSLKYGTIPVVRATGGLADTVVDATEENLSAGTATGFTFLPYTAAALQETVHRALCLYCDHSERWLALQRTGMRQDWSWNRSAAEYESLYRKLVKEPEVPPKNGPR